MGYNFALNGNNIASGKRERWKTDASDADAVTFG